MQKSNAGNDIMKNGFLFIGLLLIFMAGALLWLNSPPSEIKPTYLSIRKGDSLATIAQKLESNNLIHSEFFFRGLVIAFRADAEMQAGTYLIKPKMSSWQIFEAIKKGDQVTAHVTIPEGFTSRQIGQILEKNSITKADDFMAAVRSPELLQSLDIDSPSLEGWLFPDTYTFPLLITGEDAAREMVHSFRIHLATIAESKNLSKSELESRIILASIVEREYRQPDEAPLIASVFANRLKRSMPLQSCATVVYVLTEKKGQPHPQRVFDRDLEIKDPYNTYLNRGLPPGPISNPGSIALRAAFSPAASQYLYFRLIDADKGTHHFSVDLEGHIDAQKLFVKKVGS